MTSSALHRLADRVDRNVPSHSRPEAFHEEKSDIAHELRRMAKKLDESMGGYFVPAVETAEMPSFVEYIKSLGIKLVKQKGDTA